MGYTHYWALRGEIPTGTWELIRRDSEKLINAFPDSTEDVRADGTEIGFNGGCETFFLNREGKDRGCCKTRHVPCDKLICAILSVAKGHHPALSVSSDALLGSKPDGWPDACAWASQVLGRDVNLPWSHPQPSGLRGMWRSALRLLNL